MTKDEYEIKVRRGRQITISKQVLRWRKRMKKLAKKKAKKEAIETAQPVIRNIFE